LKKFYFFFAFVCVLIAQTNITIKAIRVSFIEDDSPFTLGNGKFDLRTLSTLDSIQNIVMDPPPHNKSYFQDHLTFAQNYFSRELGINISFEVFPDAENQSYELSHEMFYYNPNNKVLSKQRYLELYADAYQAAINDGQTIDNEDIVIIFHAGVGNDIYRDYNETPHDIPSRSLLASEILEYDPNWTSQGKSVKGIILPESVSQNDFELAMNGLVVANIGTQLGLLDLINPTERRSSAGPWALEDRGLFNANGLLPSVPSAFNRVRFLDLEMDSLFLGNGAVKQYHSNSSEAAYLKIPLNENEYYLIENRQRDVYQNDPEMSLNELIDEFTPFGAQFLNYKQVLRHPDFTHRDDFTFSERGVLIDAENFDAGIPRSGLLIWKIDQIQIAKKSSSNRINDDIYRPGIKLIEADGVYNYNTGGDGFNDERYDVFYNENPSQYYSNRIDSESFPNTRSDYEQSLTGLVIENFSSSNEVMTFDINRDEFFVPYQGELKSTFYNGESSLKTLELKSDSLRVIKYDEINFSTTQHRVPLSMFNNFQNYLLTDNDIFAYESNQIIRYEIQTGQVSAFNTSHSIDTIFYHKENVFVVGQNDLIKIESTNQLTTIQTEFDDIYFNENSILTKKDASYFYLNVNAIVELLIQSNKDITQDLNSHIEADQNKVLKKDLNDIIHYNFPISVFYNERIGDLSRIRDFETSYISVDKEGIIKFTHLESTRNLKNSIYTGGNIRELYYNGNGHIGCLTDNGFYFITIDEFETKEFEFVSVADEVLSEKLNFLWPNPANQYSNLRMRSTKSGLVEIIIYNEIGQRLKRETFHLEAEVTIDHKIMTNTFSNGTYLVRVKHKNKELILKMAVVH
jgi:hypothetical protein